MDSYLIKRRIKVSENKHIESKHILLLNEETNTTEVYPVYSKTQVGLKSLKEECPCITVSFSIKIKCDDDCQTDEDQIEAAHDDWEETINELLDNYAINKQDILKKVRNRIYNKLK